MRSHFGFKQRGELLADRDRAFLMERAMIAETVQVKLERLRLHEPSLRHVVDDQRGEVGLAGDRAHHGEFGEGEARDVIRVRMRIAHAVEHRLVRGSGDRRGAAELQGFLRHRSPACPALSGHDKGLADPVEAAAQGPTGTNNDRHRRHHRPGNSRQPRQSDRGGRCRAGRRLARPRRRAVRRLDRGP